MRSARPSFVFRSLLCLTSLASAVGARAQSFDAGISGSDAGPVDAGPRAETTVPDEDGPESVGRRDAPAVAESPPEPAREPVRTGVIGVVTDSRTGRPIAGATVLEVEGVARVRTAADGSFEIAVGPGTVSVRAFAPRHRPVRIDRLVVRRGQRLHLDLALDPTRTEAPRDTVVAARANRASAQVQQQVRREAATVQERVSREEFARAPDSTGCDVLRRIVGVAADENCYVSVRGLGGRWTSVLLNGVPLPPTDPDVPGVRLDAFPTSLIDSLSLVKTASADLPSDFAGGAVQITTRDYPERLTATLNATVGMDTLTQTSPVLTASGSPTDFLGFDNGARALPSAVPNVAVAPNQNGLTPADVTRIGSAFPNHWNLTRSLAAPNVGLGFTIGSRTRLAGRPLGFLLAFNYGYNVRRADTTVASVTNDGSPQMPQYRALETLHQDTVRREVLWALLGTAGFKPHESHEISLVGLWSQYATDSVGLRDGYRETIGADQIWRRLRWVQRSLVMGQLIGDHRDLPGRSRLRWQVFGTLTTRYEPDVRDVGYVRFGDDLSIGTGSGNISRIFDNLRQPEVGGTVDYTLPVFFTTMRVGALVRASSRTFELRRFSYEGNPPADLASQSPEVVLAPANLSDRLHIEEFTRADDSYGASQQLYAGYLRWDVPLVGRLRLSAGLRVEHFRQSVSSRSPFANDTADAARGTDTNTTDFLPSASIAVDLPHDMVIRLAYGRTVGRPMFRELAPFAFFDFDRYRNVAGNPDLRSAYVHNADLRWEWFPGQGDVLAVSGFFKQFDQAIELVLLDTARSVQPQNLSRPVLNVGGEIEGKLGFGRFHRALAPLSVFANATFLWSRVELSESERLLSTSTQRPLQGQAPFIVNAGVGWDMPHPRIQAFLYYNVVGPRIDEVGCCGIPDAYELPIHRLDAAVSWEPRDRLQLRLTARNLAFQPQVIQQGGIEIYRRAPATSLALRVQYTF